MRSMSVLFKKVAALLAAACLSTSLGAQVSIRVEESTAPVSRDEPVPIDIQLGRAGAERVILTTATEEATTAPADDDDLIDLTPATFGATRVPVPAPLTGQTTITREAETLEPAVSQTPVPDAAYDITGPGRSVPVQPVNPEAEDPVRLRPTAPRDKTTTASGDATSDLGVEETGTDYLPPADLAGMMVLQRDSVDIPLRPEQLTSAPLEVTVPDVTETTLTNGIRFYHYENRDLPRVRVVMLMEAGKNADPAEKVGLAEITARTMRSGGAAGKSGDDIDEQLEQIGSDLEFKVEYDHVAGSMFALSEKAEQAMQLLADVLVRPEFDEKKFEQQKDRALEELRRQNDVPADVSRREFRKIIYGREHPLARTPTSNTLASITVDDVRAFHEARYRPSTLWIGVAGDIGQDEARALVESAFGNWNRPEAEDVAMPPQVDDSDSTGGVFLTRKATAQSQIRLGHLGLDRRSPKAYAANVLNSIYGMGGFSSRLMNQVRTKHGYVYGVGGGIFSDDPVGLFAAIAASQAGTTAAAIKEMINVTRSVVEGPISEAELEIARRDVIFSFVNQFNTPHETIAAHMLHDYRGYEEDYLKTFPERIRSVTLEDLKQVAQDLIHPDRLKIYVIGNEGALDEPLSNFGTVEEWAVEDYSGL